MKELIVHQVNVTHYRLVELSKLADQAKPFYDWVERIAKKQTGSHKLLNEIILHASKKKPF
jgi:oligoribonuclease (3'-5' exoribonuclease)